uniref:Large ribosomal subunit protein bL21 n=1 Tax=Ammonifex degensii TaxID=42838 RepID=A0A7C2EJL2_9THEO
MYAVIETGGKQYRVEEGQRLKVEKLEAEVGERVNPRVLLIAGDGEVRVGTPELADARVELKVLRHGRGKKIIVFKYKLKKNYRRKQGHRQPFTEVLVEKIGLQG